MEEISWIASVVGVGALIGTILFGFLMKIFGRKWPLIGLSLPMIASWLLVLFAQDVNYLYVARFMHGFSAAGIIVIAPTFLIEIANTSIRGILGSTVILTAHFGVALAFVFGNYCSYSTPPIFMIILTLIFVVLFFFFPESPTFLLKQNKISQTEKSILFYRNMRENDFELLQVEMDRLKSSIEGVEKKQIDGNSLKWSAITTRPGSKALTIGIILIVLNQFGGCYAIMNYTASIFEEAGMGSTLSSNLSAMIVAIIQFVGTCLVTLLVDRAGRKVRIITEYLTKLYLKFGLNFCSFYMFCRRLEQLLAYLRWVYT